MGCLQSSNNGLGDIARHVNNTNDDNFDPNIASKQNVLDNESSLLINKLLEQIKDDPLIFPQNINPSLLWDIGVRIGKSFSILSPQAKELVSIMNSLFEQQFETKTITLHSAFIYMFSEISFRSNKEQYSAFCKNVFNNSKELLNNLNITKTERIYLKSILAWNLKGDSWFFLDLKKISEKILNKLSQPLLVAYKNLEQKNDQVLNIEMKTDSSLNKGNFELQPKFIRKNIIGISDDIFSWYGKGFIVDKKFERLIVQQFVALNFNEKDAENWLNELRNGENKLEPSLVLRELLYRLGKRIDGEFQDLMKKCFDENHSQFSEADGDDKDVGHRACSVKTKSRVWCKVFRDYSEDHDFPDAYFMVQDWVRCAIVVKSSEELMSLYKLICSSKYFGGKIIRVKNGLETRAKAEYGYRVVMINAVYKNMIVEIQCMLLPFLKMRKKMHVHYKVIRAGKSNDLAQDMGSILA